MVIILFLMVFFVIFAVASSALGGPILTFGIMIFAIMASFVFIVSLPSLIVIGLFLKYYVLYAMVGFFYVGWWEHILPLQPELGEDFIRGVTYPLHVAYMNV